MRPTEFINALGKGNPGPAYFLRGPDRFLHDECRAAVIASLPAEAREWCLAEIEFQSGRLSRELEGASQMPMLGRHSFLLFSDPDDFRHSTDADVEALERYLAAPSPFATVVFAAVEPDRRRKLITLLEKKAEVVEMLPLSRSEAAAWLKRYLAGAGVEIDVKLAEEIAAKFETSREARGAGSTGGVNLLWVRTEIEKLLTAKPGMKRLEGADLELIVVFHEEHVIGKLLRSIAERQFPQALAHLRALLASKESEVLLVWLIGDLFRQALISVGPGAAGRGMRGGWSRFSNPLSTQEIAQQVLRAYSREDLLRSLRLVRQADLGIKSSWKDSKILLEFLIWQIIVGKGTETAPAFELPATPAEA